MLTGQYVQGKCWLQSICLIEDAMLSQDARRFCREILEHSRTTLNMETGVVSRIENGRYEIVAVLAQTQVFVEGESYNYRNTVCSEVLENNKTVAIIDCLAEPAMRFHPLYVPRTMKAYLGTPIAAGGKLWGILEFTSFYPRQNPFSSDEIDFIEACAAEVSNILQREAA